ncbi:MAG TPA: hypothetical protein VEI54_00840 [Candidatus Limnocylindrales bacterium]|nr:hypothetical protein [Candidatus Limnocylindrales bacterium]
MNPAHRGLAPAIFISLTIGLWFTCEVGRAQSQSAPTATASGSSANAEDKAAPKKPSRKPDQKETNDPVALLAVKGGKTASDASAAASESTESNDTNLPADETAKKAAEIASLETQIKDKQKKIVLLMRLFVDDERAFVSDPGNTTVDASMQERRKYEQDELLWETAELAKLKARLNGLTAAKQVVSR